MNDSKDRILLIFVENPILGKVKTQLAKEIGAEKTLQIYHRLLQHSYDIAKQPNLIRRVYYSNHIEEYDIFDTELFEKKMQRGADLGERMSNAFQEAFSDGYKEVVIMGSDCWELKASILEDAFKALKRFEVVIGPAFDGGYYLLGLKKLIPALFEHKKWHTDSVLQDTLQNLNTLDIAYDFLPGLSDVEALEDLSESLRKEFDI